MEMMEKAKSAMEIISTGAQFVFQALQPDPALRSDISKLEAALSTSHDLIERCECWRFKYERVDNLLPKIKDAVYEAESLRDEYEYKELKVRVEGLHGSFPGVVSTSVTNFRNWWSGYPTEVKAAHERLDDLCVKLKETCDQCRIPDTPKEFGETRRPVTSSFSNEQMLGRDKELDEVIRILGVSSGSSSTYRSGSRKKAKREKELGLPESSSVEKKENVSVLPIVGIGGVGKTTLARTVCNNEKVKSHFEKIMWVCVSDNFDVEEVIKQIIWCATKETYDTNNLDSLQRILKEALESRRYLLVLDDIWDEDRTKWDSLFGPLKEGSDGSTIIVTTRSPKVAKITGTVTMGPLILEGLEPGIYSKFFRSCAFGPNTKSEKYPELKEIGEHIIGKLKGSPLGAKTLGGLLSTDLTEAHWRNIKDSEIWELPQKEDGILPVLQLSYQYLPSHLKKLFSFCSLFPKDYGFSEDQLTQFWISEGLITPQQAPQQIAQMEVAAKGYFHELVDRCFFQKKDHYSSLIVIHDLMHDVAQLVTKDECFRIENGDFERKVSLDIRHLSVFNKLKLDKLKEIGKYKKLRSLMLYKDNNCGFNAIKIWFNEVTNVCSLSLPHCNIKNLPECIGNLKHLRYLDISYTKIKELPNSFCNLYKLKFLDMRGCRHFECFPEGSNKLISMEMLLLSKEKVSLVHNIINLANAIQSDQLEFEVFEEDGCSTIGALKHINKNRGTMEISRLINVHSKEEAEQAQLNNNELVQCLNLFWSYKNMAPDSSLYDDTQAEVLENLCPHSNLKKLLIYGYGGADLPSWLNTTTLPNLSIIKIERGYNITVIPCLPHSITKLDIRWCSKLISLKDCLVPSNVPKLRHISISQCGELVSISVETFNKFVSLEHLTISCCPKLVCPNEIVLPPSLRGLELDSCGELGDQRISNSLRNLAFLNHLEIRNCPHLKSLVTIDLKSLVFLGVRGCSELKSLGGGKFSRIYKETRD